MVDTRQGHLPAIGQTCESLFEAFQVMRRHARIIEKAEEGKV